jgi:hypothetical protein
VLWYFMAIVRTLVDIFIPLEGKTYLVILKKI